MNSRLLKAKMVERGTNTIELSSYISINPSTFYRKIENETFSVKEVNQIIQFLKLTSEEVISIFFKEKIA